MVVNHTSRWWIGREMGWWRYWLVYGSVTVAAPIFLFLVGFVLPLSLRRAESAQMPRALRRGGMIIAAGLLLNALVFRDEPLLSGGVLQAIGLSIIVMTALTPVLRRPAGPWMVAAAAVLAYLAFVIAFPAVEAWVSAHPTLALIAFLDYAPWPWMSLVAVGLALGWLWRAAAERNAEPGYFARLSAAGVLLVVLAVAAEWRWPSTPRVGFTRDFSLNHHWIPRPITALWILGTVLVLLALAYWLCEVRGWRVSWLVMLGQTALMLYLVHQVIAFTLVKEALGVAFTRWGPFWAANVGLLVVVTALGYGWRRLRTRWPALPF